MERNKLFWFGLLTIDFGLILYFLTIFNFQISSLLNILSSEEITSIGNDARFGMGIATAVMVGWGVSLVPLSQYYTKFVKKYLLEALTVWFVLDGVASMITKFYFNIIGNLFFFAIGIWVLLTTQTTD